MAGVAGLLMYRESERKAANKFEINASEITDDLIARESRAMKTNAHLVIVVMG
jgi:hypothetical protein